MKLAQKLHSEQELEQGRIEFSKRFENIDDKHDAPHLTYQPTYEFSSRPIVVVKSYTET